MRRVLTLSVALALLLGMSPAAAGATGTEALVTVGSPTTPFSENKQNEPAVAIDAAHPNVVVAGANDNIDLEACNAANDTTCPFTPGVGVSGVYFSFDGGKSWTQPTYTGLSARTCQGLVGNSDPPCTPVAGGSIGTLPWYFENGLISDGDPAVAFGPKPVNGVFSWANGSRLYYGNLTSNLGATRSEQRFKGFEAIAVSRTDNVGATNPPRAPTKSEWLPPVIVSKQSTTTFSDKDQVWADNAESSPFFGNVYVCWAAFRGQEKSPNASPAPLQIAVSSDGGDTWTQHQVSSAANNSNNQPMDGCTIRTDSKGTAYIFGVALTQGVRFELMSRSFDGGATWSTPDAVAGPVTQPGVVDPVLGRPVIDGVGGARSDLAFAPSVDIANGAPGGADASDRIVMTYVSGGLAKPHVFFTESANGGDTWSTPRTVEGTGDRGFYSAAAISPTGSSVYLVYNAFTTPFQSTTLTMRSLVGVVLRAAAGTSGTGAFSEIHRGAPGDPRGSSQNNLVGEFLGDYVYAAATRSFGVAVWNDTRNAPDCQAIDLWRLFLRGGPSAPRPAPQQNCPAAFGNSDIFSFTTAP
ncbi:MAG TPA: sialidase family protein [Candidatus Limnocylindria bacterium]|nr:sialidase family protein [Candidatus Limnocylindria bacterium]